MTLRTPEPVLTARLFRGLHRELVHLLRALAPEDWLRPTIAGRWRVRDVAAHLLDVQIRRLSFQRDGLPLPGSDQPPPSYAELVRVLNELNAVWVRASERISPQLLVRFLELTGPQVAEFLERLDPFAPASLPVAWAGEARSENWFDIGREYTEHWHHQQQIRDAVGAPILLAPEYLHPLLALSVRALPWTYRDVDAAPGTAVQLRVPEPGGGDWALVRGDARWSLFEGLAPTAACTVELSADTAWRAFYNALPEDDVLRRSRIEGDADLARPLARMRAVMV